ncbi:MAG TPA: hypothetical protein VM187_06510, partial [Niastella sp.]|nr:hypothetical protein [Niastella sp.]
MPESFNTSPEFALDADQHDLLLPFKSRFHFPKHHGKNAIYFCGNSLGLQPKNVEAAIETELTAWREMAVGGYFGGKNPWLYYQHYVQPSLANMMGAKETEVTVMNTLTVNLHLLMQSFYRPTADRYKIIMEAGAFPSDQYAVETLVRHFNLDPDKVIIEIAPREGEKILHTSDIIQTIRDTGNQ